jgi:2-polyprenyl-6-methoxyphenol hydroxylase-like FAD-dependent oxidoreductase
MAEVVVCGGSVMGLLTSMLLARDGHDVTVLERDHAPAPDSAALAWSSWPRRGVAQFHQPHNLFSRFRLICDAELPGLTEQLVAAGCVWVDLMRPLPWSVPDPDADPKEAELPFVNGRRPVVESVVAAAASAHPRVSIRRGVAVEALLTGPGAIADVPHVTGVRVSTGERLRADLVVDAMGRQSPGVRWLEAIGARPPHVESADSGFAYYTRFFTGDQYPERRGPVSMPMGSISLLTLHGDNDTWSVTVYGQSGDRPVKALRDNDTYSRVLRACPLQAHWLDGTPITDVLPMAGVLDRYRRFVLDGRPVVTGFAAVGDAWACTNPSAGRGLSIGLIHAQVLRDVVRSHLDDPAGFALSWDEQTEQRVTPYYRNQLAADRIRLAEMAAYRDGSPMPDPDPAMARFIAAANQDPDVLRAMIRTVLCLELPQDALARPDIAARVAQVEVPTGPPPLPPGPDRAALLDLLAG